MTIEKLKKIGLSPNEAQIYLTLLQTGDSPAGPLSKHTGINRGTVYLTLKGLISLGIVAEIVGKKKVFRAENPSKLSRITKKRRRELVAAELELDQLIPALLSITKTTIDEPEVKVVYGLEAVKNTLEDITASRQSWYFFGSTENIIKSLNPKDFNKLVDATDEHREKAGRPKIYLITDKGVKNIRTFQGHKPAFREIKILPNVIKQKSALIISEEKVVIFSIGENTFATIIESKEISGMVKTIFDMLWESIK